MAKDFYPLCLENDGLNDEMANIINALYSELLNCFKFLNQEEKLEAIWLHAHFAMILSELYEVNSDPWGKLIASSTLSQEELLDEIETINAIKINGVKTITINGVSIVLPICIHLLRMQTAAMWKNEECMTESFVEAFKSLGLPNKYFDMGVKELLAHKMRSIKLRPDPKTTLKTKYVVVMD